MLWRRPRRTEEDFAAEIQSHLDHEADEQHAAGTAAAEASADARRVFGNVTSTQERFYESRRPMWLHELVQDVRYALRMLLREPLFSFVAIASLAVVVWLNVSGFQIANALLFRPLPVERADRLADIYTS